MIIITLIYQFIIARTFYHIIFVGNEPYKNHIKRLNSLKRQFGAELQEDDYWNIVMFDDLFRSMKYYVRKWISEVFKLLIFKISELKLKFRNPKTSEVEIQNTLDEYDFLNYTRNQDKYNSKFSILMFKPRHLS